MKAIAPGTGMPPEPADRNVGATSVARAFQPAGPGDFPVARCQMVFNESLSAKVFDDYSVQISPT
jgi:hypothetical protein